MGLIMVVLRVLAQILISAALILLGHDALTSLQNEPPEVELQSLAAFLELIRIGNPIPALDAWDAGGLFRDGLRYLVALPAWVVLGPLGILLGWAVGERT